MISDAEFKRRINRGIRLLDRKYGKKWREKIRLDYLDLGSGVSCVLGQTDHSYEDHRDALGLNNNSAVRYGFYAKTGSYWAWDRLTALWKAALRRRGCK